MFRLSSIQYLVFSNGVKMIPIHWRVRATVWDIEKCQSSNYFRPLETGSVSIDFSDSVYPYQF